MRVLWVFDYLAPAWQQLADRLARHADISLEIMARHDEPIQFCTSIPLTQLACRSKVDFAARKQIRQKIRSGDFDIAHAYTSRNLANLIGACRGLADKPKIVGYRGTMSRLRRLDPGNWLTFWHRSVAKITCVSAASERALRASGISRSKLSAVVEGCDADGLRKPDPAEIREFAIPPDAFVVGVLANMRPVKGIDLLLRAAQELTDLPDIYWLLIGNVSDPRITELAADPRIAKRVRLAGPRAYGVRYAELFDVFASPSRMEGFGIAVLEAMVQNVCPLVSDVGGLTELVRNEQDGLVVPPEDPSALAGAPGESRTMRKEGKDSSTDSRTRRISDTALRADLFPLCASSACERQLRPSLRPVLSQPGLYDTLYQPMPEMSRPGEAPRYRSISWSHFRDRRSAGDCADDGAEIRNDYRI